MVGSVVVGLLDCSVCCVSVWLYGFWFTAMLVDCSRGCLAVYGSIGLLIGWLVGCLLGCAID